MQNNTASNQLFKNNKQNNRSESSELDALAIAIDDTIIHDHATLNDLLARANKLEITVKKPLSLSKKNTNYFLYRNLIKFNRYHEQVFIENENVL